MADAVQTEKFGRWKDTYFDLFAGQAPTMQECAKYFDQNHAEQCDIFQAVNELGITGGNLNELFDQNLFNSLGITSTMYPVGVLTHEYYVSLQTLLDVNS